jgi:hypothetical protein
MQPPSWFGRALPSSRTSSFGRTLSSARPVRARDRAVWAPSGELAGNITIQERWVAWDEGRSFAYEGTGLPLVKRARSIWSVHPKNKRQLLLTTDAEVELKGGYFGRLLEPVMAAVFRRMAPSSLAEFKYLVENGHPYQGRHSNPPAAAATC